MSSIFSQLLLDTHDELIVDLFAGGGGASLGIEEATGRQVDIAINHDAAAIELHKANHPTTLHLRSDVFEVDPRRVTEGRPVGLLWASPDCTYHSKARGAKPIRSKTKKRRALAWVVTRWAGQVSPRIIMLENVEEFALWGPLVGKHDQLRPCPKRKGKTFRRWVTTLKGLGYQVEHRELRACDYGAPTIRKRLFVIARRDGQPIVWPEPTHGDPNSKAVTERRLKPFRTAADCIDWTIPMCSIFATKDEAKQWAKDHCRKSAPIRPLADNTMARIAKGVKRYVLENPKPFLVTIAHGEGTGRTSRWGDGTRNVDEPLSTVTTKNAHAVAAPFLVPRYGERPGQTPRTRNVNDPMATVVTDGNGSSLVAANIQTYYGGENGENRGVDLTEPLRTQSTENRFGIVATFLAQNNGGFFDGPGREVTEPLSTVMTSSTGHHGLMAAHIQRDFGTSVGSPVDAPIGTLTCDYGGHAALVGSFLTKYYGEGVGQELTEPAHTIPTVDRFGLVSVTINGVPMVVTDIAMRMLVPRELYTAQGFPRTYIIDRGADGKKLTSTDQVRMCGNSVCPPLARAMVAANAPDLVARKPKDMAKALQEVA